MGGADQVVAAPEILVVIRAIPFRGFDTPVGGGRQRYIVQDFEGHWIQTMEQNQASREGCVGIGVDGSCRSRQRREIASTLSSSGSEGGVLKFAGTYPRPLLGTEEEQLVFHDGTT